MTYQIMETIANETTTDKLLTDIQGRLREQGIKANFLQRTTLDEAREYFQMSILVEKGQPTARKLELMRGNTPISNKGKEEGVKAVPQFKALKDYSHENPANAIVAEEMDLCEQNDYSVAHDWVYCFPMPPGKDPVERIIFVVVAHQERPLLEAFLPDLQKKLIDSL